MQSFQKTSSTVLIDNSCSHSKLQKKKALSKQLPLWKKKTQNREMFEHSNKLYSYTTCNNHKNLNFYIKGDHTVNYISFSWEKTFQDTILNIIIRFCFLMSFVYVWFYQHDLRSEKQKMVWILLSLVNRNIRFLYIKLVF